MDLLLLLLRQQTKKIYIIGSRKVALGALQPFYFMIKTYKSYKIDIDPPIVYIPGSRGKIFVKLSEFIVCRVDHRSFQTKKKSIQVWPKEIKSH